MGVCAFISKGILGTQGRDRLFLIGLSFLFLAQIPSGVEAQALQQDPSHAAWSVEGIQFYEQLGFRVAWAGDVDADGLGDLLVSAPGRQSEGYVFVLNSRGESLWRLDATEFSFAFGASLSPVGDWDQDGHMDFAIGDPQDFRSGLTTGWVGVYSGKSGQLMWETYCDNEEVGRCGSALSGTCQIDAGSPGDLVVGIPGSSGGGAILVYSGITQEIILKIESPLATASFGQSLSCLGDWNQDGVDDILVGAPTANNSSGAAFIYSGLDGSLLQSFLGQSEDRLGKSVSFAGDVYGDGAETALLGAPQNNTKLGYAELHHAKQGLLYKWRGESEGGLNFGEAVGYLGDYNLDGFFDILIGDPSYKAALGRVYIYSGQTGELLVQYTGDGESWANNFGFSVFSAGDITGNDVPDLIIGAPFYGNDQQYEGKAYVFHSPFIGVPPPQPEPEEPPPVEEPEEPQPEEPVCKALSLGQIIKDFFRKPSLESFKKMMDQLLSRWKGECKKPKPEERSNGKKELKTKESSKKKAGNRTFRFFK